MHLIRILCAFNYIFNFCFILFLFFWTYSIAFLNCSKLFLSVHCYCCCCGKKKGFLCPYGATSAYGRAHTHSCPRTPTHTHVLCCLRCRCPLMYEAFDWIDSAHTHSHTLVWLLHIFSNPLHPRLPFNPSPRYTCVGQSRAYRISTPTAAAGHKKNKMS